MYKRVTFLEKKPTVSMETFSDHWEHEHGPIAANFTGLVRYHQNHRLIDATPNGEAIWPIEGIVELWFSADAGMNPGKDESVTARLIVDEPMIFRSLTGFPVPVCDIASAEHKVWVLGSWGGTGRDATGLEDLGATLAHSREELRLLQTHAVEDDALPFLRTALEPYPSPPRAMAVFEWTGDDLTADDCAAIAAEARAASAGLLANVQVVPVREVVIV